MNEKEKKGEDKRTFSLSTLSVEKPPLFFGISLYAEHVFYISFLFYGLFECLALVLQQSSEKMVFDWGPHHQNLVSSSQINQLVQDSSAKKDRLLIFSGCNSCYRGFCDSIDSFHGNFQQNTSV